MLMQYGLFEKFQLQMPARLSRFDEANQVMPYLANEEIEGVS
jgi:hypothetical protein